MVLSYVTWKIIYMFTFKMIALGCSTSLYYYNCSVNHSHIIYNKLMGI